MELKITICVILNILINKVSVVKIENDSLNEVDDHTMVTDSAAFPYAIAILEKSSYISAGALINEKWIVTAAGTMFQKSQSLRILRVRLGSINYKKGGLLLPIKSFEVHPNYDNGPGYDIALVQLAEQVRYKSSLSPIRLQTYPEEVMVTHVIVNAWLVNGIRKNEEDVIPESFESIKRKRIMTVSHLHPVNKENCAEELGLLGVEDNGHILCLDPPIRSDTCMRDAGAPVVLNGVLWGIVSPWKPRDCDINPGYIYVTLVSAPRVSSWIHATIQGQKWNHTLTYKNNGFHISDEDYDNDV